MFLHLQHIYRRGAKIFSNWLLSRNLLDQSKGNIAEIVQRMPRFGVDDTLVYVTVNSHAV